MAKENAVTIPKAEYERLRRLDVEFGRLVHHIRYAESLEDARTQIKRGQTISLSDVLKEYGMQ